MKPSKFLYLLTSILNLVAIIGFFIAVLQYSPREIKYTEYTHDILYVDKTFTDDEVEYILAATWEWSKATDGRVTYDVVFLSSYNKIDFKHGILLNKVSEDNIEILALDRLNHNSTLGYYTNSGFMPQIVLVSNRISEREYKMVVMHEIGHSLGLKHNEGDEGMNTLMYPTVELQSDYISETDLKNYCKLHHCQSKN